ncbi:hypothetical protein JW898_00370 [Candidatus Woesearchaeota archaeon]|nr:hypothetical protein [Candidatus Woesearchaeota archaeon]
MIRISLKEVSLDEVTERDYAQLRRRFLKDAKRHYSKEAWKDRYLKGLACVGAGLGAGGTALAYVFDSSWIMIPALAGVVNMCQAYAQKREATGIMVEALDRRTSGLGYAELEKRVTAADYSIPEPSEDEMKQMMMDRYALKVMAAVAEKDFRLTRYPWPVAGGGIAAYGIYQGMTDDPIAGGFTLAMGSLVFLASNVFKKRRIANVARRASAFLKEKGFAFFDSYVRRKDPYMFWQVNVLGNREYAGS